MLESAVLGGTSGDLSRKICAHRTPELAQKAGVSSCVERGKTVFLFLTDAFMFLLAHFFLEFLSVVFF